VTVGISNYGGNVEKKHYFFCKGLSMEWITVVERKRPVMAGEFTNRIYQIFSLHKHSQLQDFRFSKYTLNVGL
jgi:hypothetical protein